MAKVLVQASPANSVGSVLEASLALEAALPQACLAQSGALWTKSNAYYFSNMARMQQLWQVWLAVSASAVMIKDLWLLAGLKCL